MSILFLSFKNASLGDQGSDIRESTVFVHI